MKEVLMNCHKAKPDVPPEPPSPYLSMSAHQLLVMARDRAEGVDHGLASLLELTRRKHVRELEEAVKLGAQT